MIDSRLHEIRINLSARCVSDEDVAWLLAEADRLRAARELQQFEVHQELCPVLCGPPDPANTGTCPCGEHTAATLASTAAKEVVRQTCSKTRCDCAWRPA